MKYALTATALMLLSLPVQADVFGTVDGRSADLSSHSQMSVELNTNSFAKEFKWNGARVNYKVSDSMVVFGDFAAVKATDIELEDKSTIESDGNAYGGGLIMNFPSMVDGYNTSLKASYHTGKLEGKEDVRNTVTGQQGKLNLNSKIMNANLLISPEQPMSDTGMTWYATLGFGKMESKMEGVGRTQTLIDLSGAIAGVGIVYPVSMGELFVGYENFDGKTAAGGGFRYSFR